MTNKGWTRELVTVILADGIRVITAINGRSETERKRIATKYIKTQTGQEIVEIKMGIHSK